MLTDQLNKVGIAALTFGSVLALSACTSTELSSLDKNGPGAAKTAAAAEVDLSSGEALPADQQQVAENTVTDSVQTATTTPASAAVNALAANVADNSSVEVEPLALVEPSNSKDMSAFFPPAPGKHFAAVTIKTRSEIPPPEIEALIKKYSRIYGVPEKLVHHVAHRESTYNPAAFSRGNYGLMQIRYKTAKGLGYQGEPKGLFDAETNLKYAVKYLHNAWVVADKDAKAADWLYRTGYYYQAKSKGKLGELKLLNSEGLH